MKVLVQRCDKASVKVDNKIVGKIDKGMLVLVGFTGTDTSENIDYMIEKILHLRIYDDESGVMNKSILDIGGSILSVSQFTLYADTKKGRRPSYVNALNGEKAIILYDEFNEKLKKYIHVETGIFGAEMKVELINDCPVTIMLENNQKKS